MIHQISSGALVVQDEKLLLVHHKSDTYDFWVPPGGGVEGHEDVKSAAVRETLEETGLHVRPLRLAYLQEGVWPGHRLCKFWFYCELLSGELEINANGVVDENLMGAEFMTRVQMEHNNVLPKLLKDRFWTDLEDGFRESIFLDVEAIAIC